MRKRRSLTWLVLVLLALACNLPGRETPTPVALATPTEAADASATPEPDASSTPSASATPEAGGCTLDAEFVVDVTIPDDTEVEPGESFRKTWRVRNNGTCDWDDGTQLVYVAEDPLGGPPSVEVPIVATGAMADVSVDFVGPAEPGTYRSVWQLQSPEGERFGERVYVQVVVPGTEAPTPTQTPTAKPGPTATPTATPTLPPACKAPAAQFDALVTQAEGLGIDVSCAVTDPASVGGAFQEYWANVDHVNPHMHFRSLMVWRADDKRIYVIRGSDTDAYRAYASVYADTWDESQPTVPDTCSTMEAPEGYVVPVRGFGKVWCTHALWESVGWPAEPEAAVTVIVQETDGGLLMKVVGPPITYLIALDTVTGEATVRFE